MKFFENKLYCEGKKTILGIDEAGRGPWAGPLVVVGVIFPRDYVNEEINDSKKVKPKLRNKLYNDIIENAIKYEILIEDSAFVDKYNPKNGTIIMMKKIITKLKPDFTIVDGEDLKLDNCLKIVKGDSRSQTIAAASILAKVTRDRIMCVFDEKYPGYGFKNHKGYGTKEHKNSLNKLGICTIHRKTYKPIKNLLGKRNINSI